MYVQVDRRVSVADRADVALEVADVHRVKEDDGDEEADIDLCQGVADDVVPAGEDLLEAIEGLEERDHGCIVRFLRLCEAGFIYSI